MFSTLIHYGKLSSFLSSHAMSQHVRHAASLAARSMLVVVCSLGLNACAPGVTQEFVVNQPESVGLSSLKLNQLVEDLQQGKFQEVHSLLVYRHGVLVLEEYFSGNDDFIEFEKAIFRNRTRPGKDWQQDSQHYVASIDKSLTSMLAGIVLDTYAIEESSPIYRYLPEAEQARFQSDELRALTFHDVLQMQLGVVWDEWESDDLARLWKTQDFIAYLTSKPAAAPGSAWAYNSAGPNLMLTALDNITGDIRAFAEREFFKPLQIDTDQLLWENQPNGLPEGSARLYMRSRDLMKIGVMLLQDGKWQGQQVVPQTWVEHINTRRAQHNAQYTYGFWRYALGDNEYLSANGDGGQYINIFAEQDLVVVMTQGNYGEHPLYFNQAEAIMQDYILSGLQD